MVPELTAHLPILQVLVPLMAAPIALLTGRAGFAWAIALIASACSFLVSTQLLIQVQHSGTVIYQLGGWAAPVGIGYHIDLMNAYVLLLVSAISTVALPYAARSVCRELAPANQPLFYVYWLLCISGLMGIVATGDAFNVFVFLEISSLSTYALIGLGADRNGSRLGDRRAVRASMRYLLLGSLGCHLHRHQYRSALHDDRYPEYGRHGRTFAGGCR